MWKIITIFSQLTRSTSTNRIINKKTRLNKRNLSATLTKDVNKGWNDSLCEFVLFPACKWHDSIFVSAHVCLPRIYFFWNRHQTYNAGYIHAFSVTFPISPIRWSRGNPGSMRGYKPPRHSLVPTTIRFPAPVAHK